MWPFDDIGGAMGAQLQQLSLSLFEAAMQGLWEASLAILREAFKLADQFSMFTVDTRAGPVSVLWPMMLWLSGILALGLFFWQITVTSVRGGRGFLRLVHGPLQYGIALAVTVGLVAGFLAAADGLTQGILEYGLQSQNFQEALTHTTFVDGAVDGIKAVALGICALFGVIPAGLGFVLEMLFREAAIYVLVATIPITAAGLLAQVTATWFWIALRWILVCIAMKPVLALALVLGVAIAGGSQGLSGLLAGVGVLVISLLVPFVLFRLFAFVDPQSHPEGAFRDALSMAGIDSYGANNPAMKAASAVSAFYGGGGGDGGGDAQESANTGRFDDATAASGASPEGRASNTPHTANSGEPRFSTGSAGGGSDESSSDTGESEGSSTTPPSGSGLGTDTGGETSGGASRPAANRSRAPASDGIGPQLVGGSPGGGGEPSEADTTDDVEPSAGGTGGASPPPAPTDGPETAPASDSSGVSSTAGGGQGAEGPVPTPEADSGGADGHAAPPVGSTSATSNAGANDDAPSPPGASVPAGMEPSPSGGGSGPRGGDPGEALGGDIGSAAAPPDHGAGSDGGGAGGDDPPPAEAPDPPEPGPGPSDDTASRSDDWARGHSGRGDFRDDDDSGDDGTEGAVPV